MRKPISEKSPHTDVHLFSYFTGFWHNYGCIIPVEIILFLLRLEIDFGFFLDLNENNSTSVKLNDLRLELTS